MGKNSVNQKRLEREKQDNKALHKVLDIFLVGLVAECYLFFVYRGYIAGTIDSLLAWHSVLTWGVWVGLAVFVLALAAGLLLKKQKPKVRKAMYWLSGAGLFFSLSSWITTHFFDGGLGIISLCVLVPAVTILGLIFFLFQRECFLSTLCLGGSIFAVWVCSVGLHSGLAAAVKIGAVLSIVILAVLAVVTGKIRKDGGKLGNFTIFTEDCRYPALYCAYGVAALGVVLALVMPSIAYYLLWALGIAVFGEMVYFTTKLM